jgi:lipoyl(octanoyl) transferase
VSSELRVARLGLVPYSEALELQSEHHDLRVRGEIPDTLILLEHPHTYTVGRRGSRDDILFAPHDLARRSIEVVEADRGGQVTYHGPGQLVAYPIVDLGKGADLVGYLRRLEDVMIAILSRYGIGGERDSGNTGVWIENRKIGAIGVRVARAVTKHGFALNVSTDLSYFSGIVPCGITDKGVTSMSAEMGWSPAMDDVISVCEKEFGRVFGKVVREGSLTAAGGVA